MTDKFAVDVSKFNTHDRLFIFQALEKLAQRIEVSNTLPPPSCLVYYFEGKEKSIEYSTRGYYDEEVENDYPLRDVKFERKCEFIKTHPKEVVVDGMVYILKEGQ